MGSIDGVSVTVMERFLGFGGSSGFITPLDEAEEAESPEERVTFDAGITGMGPTLISEPPPFILAIRSAMEPVEEEAGPMEEEEGAVVVEDS